MLPTRPQRPTVALQEFTKSSPAPHIDGRSARRAAVQRVAWRRASRSRRAALPKRRVPPRSIPFTAPSHNRQGPAMARPCAASRRALAVDIHVTIGLRVANLHEKTTRMFTNGQHSARRLRRDNGCRLGSFAALGVGSTSLGVRPPAASSEQLGHWIRYLRTRARVKIWTCRFRSDTFRARSPRWRR
jgi:hypothetical protein